MLKNNRSKRILTLSFILVLLTFSSALSQNEDVPPEVILESFSAGFYRPVMQYSPDFGDSLGTLKNIAQLFDERLKYALEWSGYISMILEGDSSFVGPDEIPSEGDPGTQLTIKFTPDSNLVKSTLYLSEPNGDPFYAGSIKFDRSNVVIAADGAAEDILHQLTGMTPPYRSRIVCVEKKPGNIKELVLVNWDGSKKWPLTRDNSIALSPSWAPDGKKLVFCSFRGGMDADLYIADLTSRKIRLLKRRLGTDTAPSWSPDGSEIIFAGSSGPTTKLYRIGVDGSGLRKLTTGRSIDTAPSWSPTGREIVFMSDRTGTPQLYRMDKDGTNLRRLTYDGTYNADPSWSPNGDRIIYIRRESDGFQLRSMDPMGDVDVPLTAQPGDHLDPTWSPDGMKITYSYQGKIWVMNADGTYRRPLMAKGLMPAWSPIAK
jgi:tol-pal system beta propeller repeat protein TolB